MTETFRVSQRRYLPWLLCLLAGLALVLAASAQEGSSRQALVMTIKGAIAPAISDYYQRGLKMARQGEAELVVVELDTPGGLDTSMRDMISATLASEVPVVFYVYPGGSRAASAGTYLLYASHIAAMAPATHLGAATPVQLGGGFTGGSDEGDSDEGNSQDSTKAEGQATDKLSSEEQTSEDTAAQDDGDASKGEATDSKRRGKSAMERKTLEDAVAYIRSLAGRHGRNADWAELAVREGRTLTAQEALGKNVIDVIATDLVDLFAQIDGREVTMASATLTLDTTNLSVERFEPDWRTELLAVITNPNVAYFLMIIGFYGLIFELA
ncbi:MAG TPA: nodulation protein NfeD, partial [Halomonas sp.]|nr:nodulation protein NfeD [Halomonas sp.]